MKQRISVFLNQQNEYNFWDGIIFEFDEIKSFDEIILFLNKKFSYFYKFESVILT